MAAITEVHTSSSKLTLHFPKEELQWTVDRDKLAFYRAYRDKSTIIRIRIPYLYKHIGITNAHVIDGFLLKFELIQPQQPDKTNLQDPQTEHYELTGGMTSFNRRFLVQYFTLLNEQTFVCWAGKTPEELTL